MKTSLNYYKLQIFNRHFSWQPDRPCWLQSKVHIQFILYFRVLLIKLLYSIHPLHASLNVADVADEVQDEFTELRNDSTAHDLLQEKTLTEFWCAMRYSYPNVAMLSLRVLVLVTGTTYLCECGFSIRLQIKTKPRNRLEVQDDMRLALTQTKPRISKLVTQMQPRSSHKLLILLRHICSVTFTFLSNIFF